MTASLAERAVVGVQTPRLSWMPEGDWDFSLGEQCITWATDVLQLCLDDWQRLLLRWILARRPDGTWACREFALICSRQNGKSWVLLIRCLFGLLVMGEREIVFSAHLGDTIRDAYTKAQTLLLDPKNPERVKAGVPPFQTYSSDGRQRIQFADGAQMAFRTRTKSGGRGLTGEVLVLDEAQELTDEQVSALGPILGSKSMTGNPQILFSGSSGDYDSAVFARVRRRGIAGGATRLGLAEWSIDDEAYFAADVMERERIVRDPAQMAMANPTFGIVREDGTGGISEDYLLSELELLSSEGSAREHYGVGTWPADDGRDWVIPRLRWTGQARPDAPAPTGGVVYALSATWGDRRVAIAGAGRMDEGCYGWVEKFDRGTAWVLSTVTALAAADPTVAFLLDDGGPAGPLADELEQALVSSGKPLHRLSLRDTAQAYGAMSDAVTADPPSFWHRGQPEVDAALAGTAKKDLGSGLWVFDRKHSQSDIAPLEALALARHGWVQFGGNSYDVLDSIW